MSHGPVLLPAAMHSSADLDLFLQRPDTVELVIGYHLLEGKMVDLKKPFAILEKQQPEMDGEIAEACNDAIRQSTEYKVQRGSVCEILAVL